MVKASVEADLKLHTRFFYGVNNRLNLFRGQVNRLFTEYVLTILRGFDGDIRMGIG